MPAGITREAALDLLHRHVRDERILKHSLASEAVLAALAERLGADRERWALAGLLHDIDYDLTAADPAVHGQEGARILEEAGLDPEIVAAVRRHNRLSTGETRESALDHALAAGETITGLLVSVALILPDRRLAAVRLRSVTKRTRDPSFAPGVDRASIRECESLGIGVEELAAIALAAMQGVSDQLGL